MSETPKLSALNWALMLILPLSLVYVGWICWRASLPLQIDVNEAWNAWHTDRLARGLPLYPLQDDLITNNYPPLSFYILKFIAPLFENTLIAGRWVSIISVMLIGITTALICNLLGADLKEAIFAGLWYITTMARFFYEYMGMNDPNLLALAVMAIGLLLFLRKYKKNTPFFAFSIMIIAGLIKHNLIGIPLASLLIVALDDRTKFIKLLIFSFLCLILINISLCLIYSENFFYQLLMPRKFDLLRPISRIGRLQWIFIIVAYWIFWLKNNSQQEKAVTTSLLIICTFMSNEIALIGEGVGNNAQFELLFVTGICLGLIMKRLMSKKIDIKQLRISHGSILLILIFLRFLIWPENGPYYFWWNENYRAQIAERVRIATNEIEFVRDLKGPINCSIRNICYFANKDFVYDEFYISQKIKTEKISSSNVEKEIKERNIQFIKNDEKARWQMP